MKKCILLLFTIITFLLYSCVENPQLSDVPSFEYSLSQDYIYNSTNESSNISEESGFEESQLEESSIPEINYLETFIIVETFNDGEFFILMNDERIMGMVNKDNEIIIDFILRATYILPNGLIRVLNMTGEFGVITPSGDTIVPFGLYDWFDSSNDFIIAIKEGIHYILYNNGKESDINIKFNHCFFIDEKYTMLNVVEEMLSDDLKFKENYIISLNEDMTFNTFQYDLDEYKTKYESILEKIYYKFVSAYQEKNMEVLKELTTNEYYEMICSYFDGEKQGMDFILLDYFNCDVDHLYADFINPYEKGTSHFIAKNDNDHDDRYYVFRFLTIDNDKYLLSGFYCYSNQM